MVKITVVVLWVADVKYILLIMLIIWDNWNFFGGLSGMLSLSTVWSLSLLWKRVGVDVVDGRRYVLGSNVLKTFVTILNSFFISATIDINSENTG